jgi:glycosyltransferase involved in cell wall biosynthesis
MSAPLVTVGITCFNAQDTIARAIASAINQDWPNAEIVIVDDASGDGSVDLISRAIANEPRTRLIRHETNKGAAQARNTILEHAKGEFVAFFDDDDESLPNRLSAQVACIEAHEARTGASLVACFASGERLYSNGYAKPIPAIGSRGARVPEGREVADYLLFYGVRKDLFYGAGVPTCALMARMATYRAVSGFEPALRRVEDVDFAIRLALKGCHFVGTEQKVLVQHASVAPDKSPEKNLEGEVFLADKHANYLKSRGRYYYARNWPQLRYWHFKRNYLKFGMVLAGLMARHPIVATSHLIETGPKRLIHERSMKK